ncbi:extended synaptotagmin-1-like isoform X1 [Ascaphus truei]|uniref:extended synaptotagmin-1-like isoform X1 n=1 Tax=Ascaphus truei TaxID=8439 RepID=UPI003F590D06
MKLVMRILYLDPTCPSGTPDPESPMVEETTVGSSVDMPPKPKRTSPTKKFASESVLRVFLLEAENLIAKDNFLGGMMKGKSDPYTVIRVGGKSMHSRVVKENLNPRWEQAFEVLVTDVPGQDIEFKVFDKDLDKDDFLGSDLQMTDSPLGQLRLTLYYPAKEGKLVAVIHSCSDLQMTDSPLGQLRLTPYYPAKEGKLVAVIHSCSKLCLSSGDPPDPYVSLILLPDKNRWTKRKTAVKKRTSNPEFNEKFEWDLPLEEAAKRKMDISVKNSVSFISRERELLGKVHIDLSQVDLSVGLTQWYNLKDEKTSM